MSNLNVTEVPYTETLSKMTEIKLSPFMKFRGEVGSKASDMIKSFEGGTLYHCFVDGLYEDLWVIIKPQYDHESFRTEWLLLNATQFTVEKGITSLKVIMTGSRGKSSTFAINKSGNFNGIDDFDKVIKGITVLKKTYRLYNEKTKLTLEEENEKLDRIVLRELNVIKKHKDNFPPQSIKTPIPISSGEFFSGYIDKEGFVHVHFPIDYPMDITPKAGKVLVTLISLKSSRVFDTFDPEAIIEFVKESRVRALTDPRMTNYRKRCDDVVLSRNKENSGEGALSSNGPMSDDEVMKMIGEERK